MSTRAFPLLTTIQAGFGMLRAHWGFTGRIIAFPILITFAGFLALDTLSLGSSAFWAVIFKLPGDFIKGIFLALYIRHLMFRETPMQATENPETQKDLSISSLLYTAIGFFYGGLMALLLMAYGDPEAAAAKPSPVAFAGAIAGLGAVLFLFRYQWLPVAAAAGHDLRGFVSFLGTDWGLGLRIFMLWMLSSIPAFLILGFAGQMLTALGGYESLAQLHGPAAWLFYLVNAALSVLTATVTAGASVFAIRYCMQNGNKNV